jgi:predicted cupin superfamily sugar epimerase
MSTAQDLINRLRLNSHPEGGWFREIHRATARVATARGDQAGRSLGDYSLVGCNVGPGFEFEDFQFVSALPDHAAHFSGELARYRALL